MGLILAAGCAHPISYSPAELCAQRGESLAPPDPLNPQTPPPASDDADEPQPAPKCAKAEDTVAKCRVKAFADASRIKEDFNDGCCRRYNVMLGVGYAAAVIPGFLIYQAFKSYRQGEIEEVAVATYTARYCRAESADES